MRWPQPIDRSRVVRAARGRSGMSGTMAGEDTSEDVPHHGGKAASARQARWAAVLGLAAVVAAAFWVALAPRHARPVDSRFSRVRLLEIDRPFPPGGGFGLGPFIWRRSSAGVRARRC